jgi:hypothetical protein
MEPSDATPSTVATSTPGEAPASLPAARCPHCGARRETGVSWCGQCYADLHHPEPPSEEPPGAEPRTAEPRTAEPRSAEPPVEQPVVEPDALPAAGRTPGGAPDPVELDRIATELLRKLATVPARGGPAGALDRGVSGPGAKTAVMAGGALTVAMLAFGLLYLVGILL